MTARSVQLRQEFSPVELQAMFLAHEIVRTGVRTLEFYLPVGHAPTVEDRAASLLPLILPGRIVSGTAAGWIWTGGTPPREVEISRRSWRTATGHPLLRLKYARIPDHELAHVAGVPVVTPERALRELAHRGERYFAPRLTAHLAARERGAYAC